jgi:hypothetical protein
MKYKNILITTICLFFYSVTHAQQKFEKEYRIKTAEVPIQALTFIDRIKVSSKIKWYKEESLNDISFEAKFHFNKKYYSIEFDTSGTLQDAEFILSKKELNLNIRQAIETHLDSLFLKWKIQKIQKQYKGTTADVLTAIRKNDTNGLSIISAYELIVRGKQKNGAKKYEFTFSEKGELLKMEELVQQISDHLEY